MRRIRCVPLVGPLFVAAWIGGACAEGPRYEDRDIGRSAHPLLGGGTYVVQRGGAALSDGTNPAVLPVVNDGHMTAVWGTGTAATLVVGSTSVTSQDTRAVVRWDLAFIPSDATVTSAIATIYFNRSSQPKTVNLHRVTSAWTEGSGSPGWGTTFDAEIVGSFVTSTWSGYRDVDLTPLVQTWVGGAPNHGVLFEQSAGGGATGVMSSEHANASQRPRLVVVYTVPPPAPPGAPAGLSASAGDAQVDLAWAAASGASSYNVKRSEVTGGPYTTIATGITTPSYLDAAVMNGVTYSYVVSAVNAAGEGPDSAEVSATPILPLLPPPPADPPPDPPPPDPPPPDPPPPTTSPIRIAVVGDFGAWSGGDDPDPNAQAVADMIAAWTPDYVVTVGDNVYDAAADPYDRIVGHYYGAFIETGRFFPVLGSHDWDHDHQPAYHAYFDYLPGNRRYYEQPLGSGDLVRLFAIDTDVRDPDGATVDSAQAAWLRDRLAASTACFDVVAMHEPAVASSISGSGPGWHMLRWDLDAWGADVVLQGHVHAYERLSVDGVPYFVNGVGGGYLALDWNDWSPVAQSQFRYEAWSGSPADPPHHHGAQLITFAPGAAGSPTQVTFEFFAVIDGARVLVDSTSIAKVCP